MSFGFGASASLSNAYPRLRYVDKANGLNTNDGSYNKPWRDLDYAAANIGNTGSTLYIAPGTYPETVNFAALNVDVIGLGARSGLVNLTGGWTISNTTSSVRFKNVSFANATTTISAAGSVYLDGVMALTINKTGGGFFQISNSDIGDLLLPVAGSGEVLASRMGALTIGSNSAVVAVRSCPKVGTVTINAGIVQIFDSNVYSASSGASAIVAANTTGAMLYVFNSTLFDATGILAPITMGANSQCCFQGAVFKNATSTFGTNLSTQGLFDSIRLIAPLLPTSGGTGTNAAPTAGQLLVGTSNGVFVPADLATPGNSGVTITTASGSVSIDATIPEHDATFAYLSGKIVTKSGSIYKANSAIAANTAFAAGASANQWTLVGSPGSNVSIQNNSLTFPANPFKGDAVLVTTTGTAAGQLEEHWIYTGSTWVQVLGNTPVSGSVIDNTITNSASVTVIGRYIVPATGGTNDFLNQANKFADFDGASFVFSTPTDRQSVLINNGPNAGQVWIYTASTTSWALVTQTSGLPVFTYAAANAYKANNLVVNGNALYQANDAIAANTAFAVGTTGATWKLIGADPATGSGWTTSAGLSIRSSGGAGTYTPAVPVINRYRIVNGVYTVQVKLVLTTAATFPSGTYIYTLPNGATFDLTKYPAFTTVISPGTQLTAALVAALTPSIVPTKGLRIEGISAANEVLVVPVSSTEYRLLMHSAATGMDMQNTTNYPLNIATNQLVMLEFTTN